MQAGALHTIDKSGAFDATHSSRLTDRYKTTHCLLSANIIFTQWRKYWFAPRFSIKTHTNATKSIEAQHKLCGAAVWSKFVFYVESHF
jgi:hypothetical protein